MTVATTATNGTTNASSTGGLFSTKSFVDQGTEFPGVIELAEVEKSNFQGKEREQIHLGIRPLTFSVKNTGQFHEYLTVTNRKSSATYHFALALEALGIVISEPKQLIGLQALWTRRTVVLYKNKEQEDVTKEILLPTKLLTDAEVKDLVSKSGASGASGNGNGATNVPKIAPATELDPDTATQLAALIDGKTKTEAIIAVSRESTLAREVRQAFASGTAIKQLKESGLVTEEDGKYKFQG